MSKGKKRREARRRARQRREEQIRERPLGEEGVGAEAAGPPPAERPRREDEAVPAAGAGHSRAVRKRAKRKGGLWERVGRVHVSPWLIATPVVATVAVILVVLVVTSGSSGTTGGTSATPTPDPRVAGQTPQASISLNVDDVNFSRTEMTGNAGEVIELVVTNTGTISHNLTVAGPDNEYQTDDDFTSQPFAIKAGETGRVVLKIDDPGTYLFRCAFHPMIEFGTLVLQ